MFSPWSPLILSHDVTHALPSIQSINVAGSTIPFSNHIKLLGVTLDLRTQRCSLGLERLGLEMRFRTSRSCLVTLTSRSRLGLET